jgi:outer membrane protein insertion porin family
VGVDSATRQQGPPVVRIQFRGNRKVEDEAIRANLQTRVGRPVAMERLREDVRQIWRMGFFEDIQVEQAEREGGSELTFVVREKPSVRKIYVQGNDEIALDKINEALDLKRDAIVDLTQIKRNEEKIQDLYREKGFYLSEVTHELRRTSATEVDVWFHVQERAKVVIRDISFSGNRSATDEELHGAMQTQEGGYFSLLSSSGVYREEAFERDVLLLTAFYYDRGYINAKINRPQVTLSSDRRYIYIAIHIDEGPQYRIGSLDFKGDLIGSKSDYFKRLVVKSGEVFSRTRLSQDILKLNDYYRDRGYAYVNVSPLTAIDSEKRIVDLVFDIQRGSPVYFERINIRGNAKTRDKVIRRELKIIEGELYSQTQLDLSKRRVTQLGYFERVDISTSRGSRDDLIEVNVEVAERPTGTFQIGAGFSSVENFIAQAQISQNNLFGRGQTLTLQAQISSLRQLFLLRFVEPYLFDSRWSGAADVFNQSRVFESFTRNSTGGDLTAGYPLTDELRLFLTYKVETVGATTRTRSLLGSSSPNSIITAPIANLFRNGLTSSVRASISWDTRDNRLFPTRGMFINGSAEVADSFLASSNVFTRYSAFARFYRPILGPVIFKVNTDFGLITSRSDQGVPIFERYFAGGINDIRGFRPRSLGPRIGALSSTDPNAGLIRFNIGGNLQLVFNSELEFPIFDKIGIRGVVFFDAGNAFNLEDRYCQGSFVGASTTSDPCTKFSLRAIRTSAGFGFRWFSPIGPLRFEWGLPLKPEAGEDRIVFEFTIGNFF